MTELEQLRARNEELELVLDTIRAHCKRAHNPLLCTFAVKRIDQIAGAAIGTETVK
jgi:hypothetical protein